MQNKAFFERIYLCMGILSDYKAKEYSLNEFNLVWKSLLYMKPQTQPEITCSKLTIETLEQGVKYVQS